MKIGKYMELLNWISKRSTIFGREWFRLMEWIIVIAALKAFSQKTEESIPILFLYISYAVFIGYIFFGLSEKYFDSLDNLPLGKGWVKMVLTAVVSLIAFMAIKEFSLFMLRTAETMSKLA
jgi:hypothetical protein